MHSFMLLNWFHAHTFLCHIRHLQTRPKSKSLVFCLKISQDIDVGGDDDGEDGHLSIGQKERSTERSARLLWKAATCHCHHHHHHQWHHHHQQQQRYPHQHLHHHHNSKPGLGLAWQGDWDLAVPVVEGNAVRVTEPPSICMWLNILELQCEVTF